MRLNHRILSDTGYMESTDGAPRTLLGMHALRQRTHGIGHGPGRMGSLLSDPETRVRSDEHHHELGSNPSPTPQPPPRPQPAPQPPPPDWLTKQRVDDQVTGDGTQAAAVPVPPRPTPLPPPPDRETAVRSDKAIDQVFRSQNPAPPRPTPHTGVRSDDPPDPRPVAPRPERETFVRRDD